MEGGGTCWSIYVGVDDKVVRGPAQRHAAPSHAPLHRLKCEAAPVRQPGLSLKHIHHSSCSSSSASGVSEQQRYSGSGHRHLRRDKAESDEAAAAEAAVINQTTTVTAREYEMEVVNELDGLRTAAAAHTTCG